MDKDRNYLRGNGAGLIEAAPHLQGGRAGHSSGQLVEYWHAVSRRFTMVTLLALVGGLAGFGVALLQHPLFRARTVLDIRSLNENVLNVRENNGNMGSSEAGLPEAYLQTEIKILQSESILTKALEHMPKQQLKAPGDRSLSLFSGLVRVPEPKQAPLNTLVADASRRIKVRALGNTRIVEILCDARDGQIAADMCNNLAKAYSEHNLASRLQSTSDTGAWLSSQLESVRRRLSESESGLKESAGESFLSSETENPAQEKLRQLQAELSRSQAERIAKQSEYEVVLTSGPDALPVSLDAGPIRDYRLRLNELRRQLAELSATMTPDHYKIKELKAQIGVLDASLQKERKDLLGRLQTDYDSARKREAMLSAAYDQQAEAISKRGDKAVHYDMLKRDVDSTRKLYEALLQRVEEVNLANAMKASSISIVDKATAPTVPYSPNWPASTLVGLFAGTCLGLGIAIMHSNHDQTLRDPGEAPSQFQIRELGVIPAARPRTLHQMLGRALPGVAGTQESLPELKMRNDQVVELSTMRRDQPAVAEAFCGTMNSFLLTRAGNNRVRTVILTSPDIGDGKTSVATNLAITLARAHRRVALVDGDMRRPRLHKIFDLDTEMGLDSILRSDQPIEKMSIKEIAVPTGLESLFVVPTDAVNGASVSDLLFSSRLPALLQRLRDEFDIVIIDTPPMRFLSDARVFGSLVDGAVLVFRSGATTREAAYSVQQCLMQDGTPVLGTILNDWKPGRSKSYTQHKHQYM